MRVLIRYRWPGLLALLLSAGLGCSDSAGPPTQNAAAPTRKNVQQTTVKADPKTDPVKPTTTKPETKKAEVKPPATKPETKPAEAKVEITPIKLAEFDDFLKKQKGKVVLIDFWFFG